MGKKTKYVGWVNEPGDLIERLIIGEEMPQSRRKTFPISMLTGNRSDQITGTMGYLDFRTIATFEEIKTKRKRIILPPKIEIVSKTHLALELAVIGIEPEYQRNGYALQLLEELKNVAKGRKIKLLVSKGPLSENEPSLKFHEKAEFIKEDKFFIKGNKGNGYYTYYQIL